MRARFPLLVAVIVLLVVGYALSETVTVKLWRVGVPALRKDLRALAATSARQSGDFPPETWPSSARAMDPRALRMDIEGVLLLFDQSGTEHEGLLIMLDPAGNPGTGGSGVSYDRMSEGVYWCREKVRVRTKRAEHLARDLGGGEATRKAE